MMRMKKYIPMTENVLVITVFTENGLNTHLFAAAGKAVNIKKESYDNNC